MSEAGDTSPQPGKTGQPKAGDRRRARALAMQGLYQRHFSKTENIQEPRETKAPTTGRAYLDFEQSASQALAIIIEIFYNIITLCN